MTSADTLFNHEEVCELSGCTYRQFDYWTRTSLIHATFADQAGELAQPGTGHRRLINGTELDVITTAVYLLEVGFRLDKAFAYGRQLVETGRPVVVGRITIGTKPATPTREETHG